MEQALKGRPREEINRAQRRVTQDVLFLFFLHQQTNSRLADKERYFATYSLMLAQQLSALKREHVHNDQAIHWPGSGLLSRKKVRKLAPT